MKRLVLLVLFSLLLVPVLSVRAQTDTPEDIISSGIIISTDPEFPGPGASVVARLDSSTTDLDQSVITWSVSGKKVAAGRGVRTITLSMPADGSNVTISVTVVSPDGTFNKSLTLTGDSVDLLWEGEGYVPPFYKGRTLWGASTRATLLAVPHVGGRSTSNLSFRWTKDGSVLGTSSGTGKNSLLAFDTVLGLPQDITVDVMTDKDTVAATISVTITPISPSVNVYEDNPLLGLRFEKEAGDTFALTSREVTFAAFPFYFGTTKRALANMIYGWIANGGTTQAGSEVTYRAPDSAGQSRVSLNAHNTSQPLEDADKDFLVQFGNTDAQ